MVGCWMLRQRGKHVGREIYYSISRSRTSNYDLFWIEWTSFSLCISLICATRLLKRKIEICFAEALKPRDLQATQPRNFGRLSTLTTTITMSHPLPVLLDLGNAYHTTMARIGGAHRMDPGLEDTMMVQDLVASQDCVFSSPDSI